MVLSGIGLGLGRVSWGDPFPSEMRLKHGLETVGPLQAPEAGPGFKDKWLGAMPAILSTQETEIGRIEIQSQPGK
jgi:hypothetical protein